MAMRLDVTPYTEPLSLTPATLRAVLQGRPDDWLDRRHAPDVVSPRETVAHLLLCEAEETWIDRVRHLLDPDHVCIPGSYAGLGDGELSKRPLPELLDAFETQRTRSLHELEALGLTIADLEGSITEEGFGTQTVENVLNTWVAHDLYHLGQIFKSYSAVYADRIGPYQTFLNLPHFN